MICSLLGDSQLSPSRAEPSTPKLLTTRERRREMSKRGVRLQSRHKVRSTDRAVHKSRLHASHELPVSAKKSVNDELLHRMKDSYVSPAVGSKYSHERIMDRYNSSVMSARQERYREILEKIKERVRPMDHDDIRQHGLEYLSSKVKQRELRQEEARRHVRALQQMQQQQLNEYAPARSSTLVRLSETELSRNPTLQRLEKAKKAIETRKQYSDIVKEVFFKDALIAARGSDSVPQLTPREVAAQDVKRRRDLYPDARSRYEHGNQYLAQVHRMNSNVTTEKRKEMDERRFFQPAVPKQTKSRKYLDEVSRQFKDPREFVRQQDLLKDLQKAHNSESRNALLANIKNFDSQMDLKEQSLKFVGGKGSAEQHLTDLYVNNIESKLKLLDRDASVGGAARTRAEPR